MPKIITNEQRELIIELNNLEAQTNTISKATGLSTTAIRSLIKLYEAVDTEDYEWLSKYLDPYFGGSKSSFVWVCEKLGKDPDDVIRSVGGIDEEQPCEQNVEEATPAVVSQSHTTPFYIQQMLLNEAKIIELLTQLCDTVIPTHMKMLRADNEKNIDLVCERMKMETDAIVATMADTNKYLDNIRYNTRSDKKPRPAYIIEKGAANA